MKHKTKTKGTTRHNKTTLVSVQHDSVIRDQEEIIDNIRSVKHDCCEHWFYVCNSVLEYQEQHALPCPICKSDYAYNLEAIHNMTISMRAEDEPDGKPLLVCCTCHGVLCQAA